MSSLISTETTKETGGLSFDWLMAILSTIFVSGLFLDGWAHNHGRVDESFFTPWHAFFYAGFGLTALALGGLILINRTRGVAWSNTLPRGYRLSLLGAMIFAAGGVGDLIWHELFGIEESFEALVSPTHLLLGLGIGLIVTGPFRAAWRRTKQDESWVALGPMLLALTLLISTFTFFMMFSHPLVSITGGQRHRVFSNEIGQVAGVTGVLLITALIMGPLLPALHRWQFPRGALTLVLGINVAAMALLDWESSSAIYMAGAMLLGVVLAEVYYQRGYRAVAYQTVDRGDELAARDINARAHPIRKMRTFAFLLPVLHFGGYYIALLATEGTRWSIHVWAGNVILAGTVGWLMSYLVFPPQLPERK